MPLEISIAVATILLVRLDMDGYFKLEVSWIFDGLDMTS